MTPLIPGDRVELPSGRQGVVLGQLRTDGDEGVTIRYDDDGETVTVVRHLKGLVRIAHANAATVTKLRRGVR